MVFIKWVKRPPSSCTCPSALPFIVVLKPYVYGFAKKRTYFGNFMKSPRIWAHIADHWRSFRGLWIASTVLYRLRFLPSFHLKQECFWTRFSALLTSLQQKFSLQITGFHDSNLPEMFKICMAIDHPQWKLSFTDIYRHSLFLVRLVEISMDTF